MIICKQPFLQARSLCIISCDGHAWYMQVAKTVMNGGRLEIPDDSHIPGLDGGIEGISAYRALLQRCWAQSPQDRPSFDEIVDELRWVAVRVTTK